MRLYLIRHAQPDYPGGKKMCLGQKNDLPLSAAGFAQAQALGDVLADLSVDSIFSSPMLRARQTAERIAGGSRTVTVIPSLTELDGGEWDGLTFEEIRARCADSVLRPSCPPGGESDEDGFARALCALEQIRLSDASCAAAVSHGALIRALLCGLTQTPTREKKRFAQECAAVSILDFHHGKWSVGAYNIPAEELRRHIHGT